MARLRTIATILAILAVAGGPALAKWTPCHCLEVAKRQLSTCCTVKSYRPAGSAAFCGHPRGTAQDGVDRGCCVQPLPAQPPSEQSAPRSLAEHLPLAIGGFPAVLAAAFGHEVSRLCVSPGLDVPVHPPLSVLYCTWLE